MAVPVAPPTMNSGTYDEHKLPHYVSTTGQLTLFIIWLFSVFYLIISNFLGKDNISKHFRLFFKFAYTTEVAFTEFKEGEDDKKDKNKGSDGETKASSSAVVEVGEEEKSGNINGNNNESKEEPKEQAKVKRSSAASPPPTPTFDELVKKVVIFGAIMMFYFLADYKKFFPVADRIYNADQFLFLVFLLFLVGCCFTLKPTQDKILNRDQTEEWKGWMQVMFVWYHYFAAKPWYNWIRVYIAAYVWMTGFGNFSFFWVRADFSLWRMLKMLFRLNFLVIFVCVTVDNPYMLYYICAMHTYWFLSVSVFMAVLPSWNKHRYRMILKFAAYAIANAILFEVPGLHMTVFRPFKFLLGFNDGKFDVMHEWAFRSGLDHWACFIGMICAYNYPYLEKLMIHLETKSLTNLDYAVKLGIKLGMVVGCLGLYYFWHTEFLVMEKFAYNKLHPYTSWIPIVVFIILRNIHPVLRTRYIHMFAWLGKITLETYISQLHIYLQSNAKELIGYITGYPLLTFSMATIIYLTLSHQLFNITNTVSSWLFPKNYREIGLKAVLVFGLFATATLIAFMLKTWT